MLSRGTVCRSNAKGHELVLKVIVFFSKYTLFNGIR